MTTDVYAPCPCGSGKKLKFCCAPIVDDMAKVARLQLADQPRQAIQLLERLEKSHPDNPWVVTRHAEILVGIREAAEAKARLEKLLSIHPDYSPAFAILGMASLFTDGFEGARPAIYRAFQKCIPRYPKNAGLLALSIGLLLDAARRSMSARQHVTLAMRLLEEEARQDVFVMLLKMDGNSAVPYPMRNVHHLGADSAGRDHAEESKKAGALSRIGCWGPAGRVFAKLAEQQPQNAGLWRNVALCRAWDADEAGASEAFHRAAAVADDFEFAVECETLAQLFDLKLTENSARFRIAELPIRSASRTLGLLGENDRVTPVLRSEEDEDDSQRVAGEFVVVDRPVPADAQPDSLGPDDIPTVAAWLTVLDGDPEVGHPAAVLLRGYSGENFDAAKRFADELLADEREGEVSEAEDEKLSIPREHVPYLRQWQFPRRLPISAQRALAAAAQRRLFEEVWPNAPQAALDGKSPLAVKDDPAYRVRLAASAYVLDALAQQQRFAFDVSTALRRLGLEPLRPIEPKDDLSISSLSPMQLHRLPVSRLTDTQLVYTYRRAMLIGHRRFLNEILVEILSRPACLEQIDVDGAYRALVNAAREEGRLDDAIRWLQRAKEHAATRPNAFELTLGWTVTEFWMRAEQPDDPELPALYRTLAEYYAPKVPQVAALLENFREQFGTEHEWLSGAGALLTSGAAAGTGGIWTPQSAAAPASTPGKLWLPGQE